MSEEFDKEAEREKLRKKFAEDEKKRENTRRMSELLLKGATMTNRHCEECGDPIFRQDDREFCPTCNAATAGANSADAADARSARSEGMNPEDATHATGAPNATGASNVTPDGHSRDRTARDPSPSGIDAPARDAPSDLTATRESLLRTLARFSRAAEETDDPRRARDHLRAAREAAETLRALE